MSEVTIDHEVIRRWAEGKGGKPAAVERTHRGGDVGEAHASHSGSSGAAHRGESERHSPRH